LATTASHGTARLAGPRGSGAVPETLHVLSLKRLHDEVLVNVGIQASTPSKQQIGLKTVVVTGLGEGDVHDHGPRRLETVRTGRGEEA